jgi:hypothetical protein
MEQKQIQNVKPDMGMALAFVRALTGSEESADVPDLRRGGRLDRDGQDPPRDGARAL